MSISPDRLCEIRARLKQSRDGTGPHSLWTDCDIGDLLLALDAATAERDAWKDAIIDAAVVDWIYTKEHDSDPRKAVNDLLCWQQKIALDPAVSKEAHDLHQRADAAEAELARLRAQGTWQPIETAPKGSWLDGPNLVTHPYYVAPPDVWLLLENGQRCVGAADAYYAEGGGHFDGGSYWVESFSGERVTPTHWQPLPAPPNTEGA